jgi:prepilin peptidase CpaA
MKWLFFLGVVVAVLATAEDLWRRKVSNYVTAGAFVSGIALHAWLFGWGGVWESLLGGAGGFLAFLIFFVLGGMGGGDVKLMAGFGAIVGGDHIVLAVVLVAMLGGLMAVAFLAFRKLRDMTMGDKDTAAEKPAGKAMIPYAPAISLGMLLTFVPDLL